MRNARYQIQLISIHAPTRGATGDRQQHRQRHLISIHAPTRGATLPLRVDLRARYFNPRSHEGSDSKYLIYDNGASQFQSTLPRGERRSPARRPAR